MYIFQAIQLIRGSLFVFLYSTIMKNSYTKYQV